MAFVGISRDFMARVNRKIDNMHGAELKTLGQEKPKLHIAPTDPFYMQTLWGVHTPLFKQIPTEWISYQESMNFKFRIPDANRVREMDNWFEFRAVSTNTGFPVPPRTSMYDTKECDPNNPVMAEILDYAIKQNEIGQRWETVKAKVTQFLDACKSANEAVKLWPEVKTYFDAEDLRRIETKTTRAGSKDSAAAEALANIDTGEIMSAAVIARLSGAQV